MHLLSCLSWRPIALVLLAGGLGAGTTYIATSRASVGPLAASVSPTTTQATLPAAASAAPPRKNAAAAATAPSDPLTAPAPGRRALSPITAIAPSTRSFTIREPDGDELTYRVLDTTVFRAGRDRPYSFDLLKVGDQVVLKQARAAAASPPGTALGGVGGSARLGKRGSGELTSEVTAEPVARLVVVHPAGERKLGMAAGAGAAGRGAFGAANQ